jgi:Cu+-exporting ATPase
MATKKISLNIEGMHCGSCATGIQMYLSNTDGVSSCFVDYNSKKGDVEFDDEKVKIEDILKGVEELGYKAKVAE